MTKQLIGRSLLLAPSSLNTTVPVTRIGLRVAAALGTALWLGLSGIAEAVCSSGNLLGLGSEAPSRVGYLGGGWIGSYVQAVNPSIGGDPIMKNPVNFYYEPIAISTGADISPSLRESIKSTLNLSNIWEQQYLNGYLMGAPYGKPTSQLNFANAMLGNITFPSLDASNARSSACINMTIVPGYVAPVPLANLPIKVPPTPVRKPLKWTPAHFELSFKNDPALTYAARRTTAINQLSVTQNFTVNGVSGENVIFVPTSVSVPDLVITLDSQYADPFYAWSQNFLINGQHDQTDEKEATLKYLAPDHKTVLFTLTLKNLGIFSIQPDTIEGGPDAWRKVKIRMYCESITFE